MRSHLLAAGMAVGALTLVTACGALSSGSADAPATTAATPSSAMSANAMADGPAAMTLRAEQTGLGAVLATGSGLTLYYYTGDQPGSGISACTGSCAVSWPPLIAPVQIPPGVKLAGPVGQITRPDGLMQVTVDGYPIYRYTGDTAPGQANGNGVSGTWHVVHVRTATHPRGGLMRVQNTAVGSVLANPHGLTVYYFTADQPGSGISACTGGCAATWPPVVAPVRIPGGVSLAGPVGFIVRPDGTRQVTIDGYPIYRYAGDKIPGQVNGNGIGGKWRVIHVS
jgi:predicted lipoprotein with Yx(FWY)xxD motif